MRDEARYFRGGLLRPAPYRFALTGETVTQAAVRLGIAPNTIRQRFAAGWTEADLLTYRSHERPYPRGYKAPHPPRPGVKLNPLTKLELATLQMLTEGFRPKEFLRKGETLHAVHQRILRMRLKLDAFSTAHMVAIGVTKGLVKLPEDNKRTEFQWLLRNLP